jgi:hypothetical protein
MESANGLNGIDSTTPSSPDESSHLPLEPGMCGAKSKRSGQPCRSRAMANGRCRMHGGKSLRGTASPSYKHGQKSRSFVAQLPERLRERFEAAMSDPDLLSLRKCAALADVRLLEVIDRWKACDAGDFRPRLIALCEKLEAANADKENPERSTIVATTLTTIVKLIRAGGVEAEITAEVGAAIKELVAVTSQENRRMVELNQFITPEQLMAILMTIKRVIDRNISDRRVVSQIGADLENELGLLRAGRPQKWADDSEAAVDAVDVTDLNGARTNEETPPGGPRHLLSRR